MKRFYHLLFIVFAVVIASCSKDKNIEIPEREKDPSISLSVQKIESGATPNIATNLTFNSTEDWVIENPNDKLVSVSPASGIAGDASVAVKWLSANQDNEVRELSFTIKAKSGKVSKDVKVTQRPVFLFEKTNYLIDGEGGDLTISFTCNMDFQKGMNIYTDSIFETFCSIDAPYEKNGQYEFIISVQPNDSGTPREGIFLMELDENTNYRSTYIYITQYPKNIGVSKDYSQDGKVTTLQEHSQGQGVPIIVMGDAFIDTDIENGTYEKTLREACDKLFTIEPMTSLKPYFDIFMVNAVSKNNLVAEGCSTAFKSEFEGGASTFVFGDADICEKYALKAIGKEKLDDALMLVIINDNRNAGTCSMDFLSPKNEVCVGRSVAFVPLSPLFETTLHHEVIGHGLAKLDDEYGSDSEFYASKGSILDSKNAESLAQLKTLQKAFALLNVSLESDVTKTPWNEFAKDSRYAAEKIGMFEGGDTFPYGVYRSTENSLMRNGTELNAISRCLLYKRIMSIANNYKWDFDYETFVKFDEPARKATRSVAAPANDMWGKKRSRPIFNLK